MIANLIATIMMALGVVSGTKATSNTFYDAEHTKPIQRAVVSNNYTCSWTNAAQYDNTETKYWSYKQFLMEGTNSSTLNQGRNVLFDPYLIENTAYTISEKRTERITKNYIILKFTNYTNSVQQIDITSQLTMQASHQGDVDRIVYESYDTTLDSIIDITLNENTKQILETTINNATKTTILNTHNNHWITSDAVIETETPQITLESTQNKYVLIINRIGTTSSEDYGWLFNKQMTIQGTYIQQNITQEIVDIPNVMYTVLTMPFSFISTAFNLTVFPNTPYALNFGNLFLTIVAIFILLWIIKKVFH